MRAYIYILDKCVYESYSRVYGILYRRCSTIFCIVFHILPCQELSRSAQRYKEMLKEVRGNLATRRFDARKSLLRTCFKGKNDKSHAESSCF